MNILFQYLSGGGGALSNIVLLLQSLSKEFRKDHISIVCSGSSGLKSLMDLPNVEIISYGGGVHQEIDRAILGLAGLSRIAKERRADVIWSLNLGCYSRISAPHVLSVNNPHQVYPLHVTRSRPESSLHVLALRWFFRKSLRASDGVIVQTPIMGNYVRNIAGSPKRVVVVPKAVETGEDVMHSPLPLHLRSVLESGLGKQAFTFLYVSTYFPHKNHKTLVEAFSILASQGVAVRAVFTIEREELLKIGGDKAASLIETGHLVPFGWTEKTHLKSLYDSCDACIMPSVLESLSSAHLEAMQWGKPQIVADLSYASDLCMDAALYAKAENPADWVVKIKELMSSASLRTALVEAGHERMKQFPATWADAAHRVHKFLEKIVNNPSRGLTNS